MNRIINMLLAFLLCFSSLSMDGLPIVKANTDRNVALHKPVKVSSTYPGKPWSADKLTDGIVDADSTKNSRWSSKRIGTSTTKPQEYDQNKEQWAIIDLQEELTIAQINIYWEGAYANTYQLQVSTDGTTFTNLDGVQKGNQGWQKHHNFEPVQARYVKVLCLTPRNPAWGYSMFEVEVFSSVRMSHADDVIVDVQDQNPTIAADGKTIVLPSVPEGFKISLYGSDNQQVVAMDQSIIEPLIDMPVHVMYKVENVQDPKDVACSTKDAIITIPGRYQKEENDNKKPNVVPSLREWKGHQQDYQFQDATAIVMDNKDLEPEAKMIQSYFKTLLKKDVSIKVGKPSAHDLYLKKDADIKEVGNEGYILAIDDYITIHAATYKGMIYGATSVTQILYQNKKTNTIPKGIARDYPKYEVRAGMIDVGRMYIPLDYLKELSIYMSWFKLNEIHVHINDYWNQSGYSAFRLESETYPMINASDGYYTKADYKQYQKDMKQFGMDVITEIDSPFHAESFRAIPGIRMLEGKKGYLDITTQEAFDANRVIMERLFDEYLDGEDPVIQSKNFHIGTDEYSKKYGEQMRKWTDHFANYVNQKGYKSRAWASLGRNGFQGTTPVTKDITMNLWAPYWADVQETYASGYDVINTYGGWLYIVPAGAAGYPDRIHTQRLYEEFEVNNFKSGRNPSGEAIMPFAHPQTKGAEFAVWNDTVSFKTGFSWHDIFDRMKDAVCVVSEKTWFGEDQADQSYAQFRTRIDDLQDVTPNANPGCYVESKGEVIADYDFTNVTTTLKDQSENHYDALVHNPTAKNNALVLDQTSYISLPMKSIGYPYSVCMDVTFDELQQENVIFNGAEGKLYVKQDGKIYYQRGAYTFTFDFTLKAKKDYSLAFIGDAKALTLYCNGKKIGEGNLVEAPLDGKKQQSSTFILPTEEVLKGVIGRISKLKIYNRVLSDEEVRESMGYEPKENIAFHKKTSVSGLEVNDGRFTADLAVDGIVSSTSRVSLAKDKDEQWFIVDLGKTYEINEVVIQFESAVNKYEIYISEDGVNDQCVYTRNEEKLTTSTHRVDTIRFAPVQARYVKFVQKERWKHSGNGREYSSSFYEFEVYQSLHRNFVTAIDKLEEALSKYEVGQKNGQLDQSYYDAMQEKLVVWKEASNNPQLTNDEIEELTVAIHKEQAMIETHICYVKQEAIDAYNQAIAYPRNHYSKASYEQYVKDLQIIKEQLDQCANYKDVLAVQEALKSAQANLVAVHIQALEETIKQALEINLSLYESTDAFVLALKEAQTQAQEPLTQESVEQATNNLKQAMKDLVLKAADYTVVDDAIARATALNKEDYLHYDAVQKAIDAVKRGYDITRQNEVNEMAMAINDAMKKLVKASIVPTAMSATLNDCIQLNVYVRIAKQTLHDEHAYVVLEVNDQDQTRSVKYFIKDFKEQHGQYVVSIPLYARMMSDEVVMRVYSTNEQGEVVEDTKYTYSIMEYGNKVLAQDSSTKEQKEVVEAMLNYGAMAQTYFAYNIDHLANQQVVNKAYEQVRAADIQNDQARVDGKIQGMVYATSNLRLLSQTAIRHHFVVSQALQSDVSYYVVENGVETKLTPTYYDGEKAYVEVENIFVENLNRSYHVKVVNDKTKEEINIYYSALSYAYEALEKSESKELQDVMKAMVVYNQKALAYQATLKKE